MSGILPGTRYRLPAKTRRSEEQRDSPEPGQHQAQKTFVQVNFRKSAVPQTSWITIEESKAMIIELLAEIGAEDEYVNYIDLSCHYLNRTGRTLNKHELKKLFSMSSPLAIFQKHFEYDVDIYHDKKHPGQFYLKLKRPYEEYQNPLKLAKKVTFEAKPVLGGIDDDSEFEDFEPEEPKPKTTEVSTTTATAASVVSKGVKTYQKPEEPKKSRERKSKEEPRKSPMENSHQAWVNDETMLEAHLVGLRLKKLDSEVRRVTFDKIWKLVHKAEEGKITARDRSTDRKNDSISLLDL